MTRRRRQAALTVLATVATLLALAPAASATRASATHAKHRPATARVGLSTARNLGRPGRCRRRMRQMRRARMRRLAPRARRRLRRRARRHLRSCRRQLASQSRGPGQPLYWGATIGDQITGEQAPWDMGAVDRFEQMAGKGLSLVNFFSPFANCADPGDCYFYEFPTGVMGDIRDHGAIPVLSWSSQSIPAEIEQPDFQLADTIAGRYDDYIRRFAEDARDWGHPFFLRFNWEMNGNWFEWMEGVNGNQPGESVAAWRHVHDIFAEVGADNVSWVWCPNVDPYGKLGDLASLYPGDSYVDWTGLDGYNWGTSRGGWIDFGSLYGSTYRQIADSIAPGKPMLIGEIGSSERGGSKAAWISEALAAIPGGYPNVRGMLWFDTFDDGIDWPIESSPGATDAFATGIQDPSYRGSDYGGLAASPIPPPV